jgi:hypothetical protein
LQRLGVGSSGDNAFHHVGQKRHRFDTIKRRRPDKCHRNRVARSPKRGNRHRHKSQRQIGNDHRADHLHRAALPIAKLVLRPEPDGNEHRRHRHANHMHQMRIPAGAGEAAVFPEQHNVAGQQHRRHDQPDQPEEAVERRTVDVDPARRGLRRLPEEPDVMEARLALL